MSLRGSVSEFVVTYTADDERFYMWLEKTLQKFNVKYDLNRFAWCDDFSKARNYGLEKATGDWILVIDTDEVLEKPIKKLNGNLDWYLLNIDNGLQGNNWSPRLFKNHKGINFKYKLHESIEWAVINLKGAKAVNNSLIHSGLTEATQEELEARWQRNIRILESDTDNPYRNFHFANLYACKKDHIKALNYAQNALNDEMNPESKATLCNLIFDQYCALNMYHTGIEFLKMSLEYIPMQVRARKHLINYLYQEKKKDLLLEELYKVGSLSEHKQSDLPNDEFFDLQILTEKIKEVEKWQ